MGKVSELEAENADLRNIIETKNVELEKQNSDLKIQLGQVIDKLDKILEENITQKMKSLLNVLSHLRLSCQKMSSRNAMRLLRQTRPSPPALTPQNSHLNPSKNTMRSY